MQSLQKHPQHFAPIHHPLNKIDMTKYGHQRDIIHLLVKGADQCNALIYKLVMLAKNKKIFT